MLTKGFLFFVAINLVRCCFSETEVNFVQRKKSNQILLTLEPLSDRA